MFYDILNSSQICKEIVYDINLLWNFREEIEALSKKDKKEIEQKDFPHLLSALPCLLANYPVFSNKIEREDLEKYVHERFGIHDEKSAVENIHSFVFNNTQAQFEYCLNIGKGKQKIQMMRMRKPKTSLKNARHSQKNYIQKYQIEGFVALILEKLFAWQKNVIVLGI